MIDGLFSQGIKKNGEQSVSLGVTQRFPFAPITLQTRTPAVYKAPTASQITETASGQARIQGALPKLLSFHGIFVYFITKIFRLLAFLLGS